MTLGLLIAAGAARAEPGWDYYGADPGGTRYSAADEITPSNVKDLVRAWTYRTGHAAPTMPGRRKFEATPILAEGKLVLCSPFNVVIALDPETGAELWRRDPKVDMGQRPANKYTCRGVAFWRDPEAAGGHCTSRILTGTNDYRLLALDLADGRPCDGFGENGEVRIDPEFELVWPGEFQITSPPVIVGDTVVVGSAISDNVSVKAPKGTVRAFDVRTGAPKWSFDPIPRDGTAASLGWPSAPVEGHANVWAPMSADPGRGLIFLPTSSPSPDFFGGLRPGDNRYANSVVALDAATGAVRWSFQTVHHDVWDYDVPSNPLLAAIRKDGEVRDAVIQTTKTGLVFTLDRDTGEPLFPVEERAVPQGGVPGEALSPTQPFPSAPRPLTPSTIAPEDAYGLTSFDRSRCAKTIAGLRADGLFTPPTIEGTIFYPFTGGGANWGGAAFDPLSNRLYVNTSSAMHRLALVPRAETDEDWHDLPEGEQAPMRGAPYAMQRQTILGPFGLPCNPPPWGVLHAIDMSDGSVVWETILGTTEELAPLGIALATGTPNVGGPLVTKGGLVFIGAAMDSYLRAFDAGAGAELWSGKLPAGGQATPMTYVFEGRQYVVIAAGGHGDMDTRTGDYVIAYALPRDGDGRPAYARPGRSFLLNMGVISAIAVGAVIALVTLLRRRNSRKRGRESG